MLYSLYLSQYTLYHRIWQISIIFDESARFLTQIRVCVHGLTTPSPQPVSGHTPPTPVYCLPDAGHMRSNTQHDPPHTDSPGQSLHAAALFPFPEGTSFRQIPPAAVSSAPKDGTTAAWSTSLPDVVFSILLQPVLPENQSSRNVLR